MTFTIRVFNTPHDAGIYVASLAEFVIMNKRNPVLGLATGQTPVPFYESLVRLYECGLDLSHVTTINLDEYVGLSAEHPQSYFHFMKSNLFSKTNLSSSCTFVPNGASANLVEECLRYDEILKNYPIDLQILGIGINGHIGFNEPSDTLIAKTHVVELRHETIKSNARFFDSEDQVPKQAITMGIQSILQAKKIVLMAFGTEKSKIIEQVVIGNVSTTIPASILQFHPDVMVILDQDGATDLLKNTDYLDANHLKIK